MFAEHQDRCSRTVTSQDVLGAVSKSYVADKCQSDLKSIFNFWKLRLYFFLGHLINVGDLKERLDYTVALRVLGFYPFLNQFMSIGRFMGF